jgi:hypothetical protein
MAISNGVQQFKNLFGFAGTQEDEGYEAALYAFKWSSLGYFTRIASKAVPPKRSSIIVGSRRRSAQMVSSKTFQDLLVYMRPSDAPNPQNTFTVEFTHEHKKLTSPETISFTVDFSDWGIQSTPAGVIQNFTTARTFQVGDNFSFEVFDEDGDSAGVYTYSESSGVTVNDEVEFVNLLLSEPSIAADNGTVFNIEYISDQHAVSINTKNIYFGPNAKIKILSDSSSLFTANEESTGQNAMLYSLIDAVNYDFKNVMSPIIGAPMRDIYGDGVQIMGLSEDRKIILAAPSEGANSKLVIGTEDINDSLGFTNGQEDSGEEGASVGSFRARYRGLEGNTLQVVVSDSITENPRIDLYFRGSLVYTIVGYNFNPESEQNLSKIISDNSVLSELIVYNHGREYTVFDEEDDMLDDGTPILSVTPNDVIGDGTYTLSGGNNGGSINYAYDLLPEIEKYENNDLYDIDIIAAPGYPEMGVHRALLDGVCAQRQDCFSVIDMPEIAGTSGVDNALRWINGNYPGRSEKIDSIYGALYFPYIKIKKTLYNTNMEIVKVLGDYTPSTRVLGMICRSDYLSGTKFAGAAGEQRGVLEDIDGVQLTLKASDRDRLYADAYDACINPVAFNIQSGFYVSGQKTTLRKNPNGKLTALSRVNVMRIGLYIKKEIERNAKFFYHEPNDPKAQSDFAALLKGIMNFLFERRAIEGNFIVKCDSTTNTDMVVNNNGLLATIEYTPNKLIERIKVIANIKEKRVTVSVQ